MGKWTRGRRSGSLTPRSVNNDSARSRDSRDDWWYCTRASRGARLVTGDSVQFTCMSFTMKALAADAPGLQWNGIMAMLRDAMVWPCYGHIMAAATAAASGRRQAVSRLPCRSGDSKRVCSSYGPSSLLPASELRPCLPLFGEQCYTVRYSETGINWKSWLKTQHSKSGNHGI